MLWFSKSLPVALILLIFHSHFISFSSSSSSVQAKCRPETRTALLNLTTCQSQWDFNNTADCCTWDGVSCDSETGHVISLSLVDLNATITSTSSLFSLIHLQSLDFYSYVYTEIGSDAFDTLTRNLTKLQVLYFMKLNLSSVPPSSLMNLSSSLMKLEIISCHLTDKLAQNSFYFPNLTVLDLSDNNLQGPIPPWIFALPNLSFLNLENNLFTGEISEFQTSSLSWLGLGNNTLQGAIPRSLFQEMSDLDYINLSSNNLSGTVELQDLSNFIYLSYLLLSDNNLYVTNNCKNCSFDYLSTLTLSSCNLTEFPHFIRSSKRLSVLDLSNNQIQDIVPKWLNELEHLKILDLGSNFFFGPLPKLSFEFNVFSGSKNHFSGEIPSSIFNITSFDNTIIDLSCNHLSGRIPPFIGNVQNLFILDLRSNNLSGPIPESLFIKNSLLESLSLNGNQLEEKLPRSLVRCRRLKVLDLGNNHFDDTFPEWLDSLPHLQVLVLRANKFHGSVGNSQFQQLKIIDLSHNDFTGALPTKYFYSFKAMKIDTSHARLRYVGEEFYVVERNYYQDLSYYYYPGSVRVTMKGVEFKMGRIQTIFTTIDLSSNKFTGEIPELLGNLKSLKGLNLSHNMLTGILPPSLGNLTNLEWLDLSSNELVGMIPAELEDIPWLSNLDLSYNHLEGPIPSGLQFNTFHNESFKGNLNLCGFPLSNSCGGDTKLPLEPSLEQDDDVTDWFNWRIVWMGFASGLVIGVSIGYILLYSNGKLHWLSATILEEIKYRRVISPKRRNVRRPARK